LKLRKEFFSFIKSENLGREFWKENFSLEGNIIGLKIFGREMSKISYYAI